jgi:glycerophosphoryl diester phosphodiesterase
MFGASPFRPLRWSRFLPALALLGFVLVLGGSPAFSEPRCVPSAHRGERSRASDNSVEAIRAARGLPYVEVDVRLTADNDLVLFHDRRLSPVNFRGDAHLVGRPIASVSREELAAIRLPDGSKIPKLRTVLREARELGITLMLDVKVVNPRDFKGVMEEVHESGSESHVVVQCQTREALEYVRGAFPKVEVLARAHSESEVGVLLAQDPDFVQVDHDWNLSSLVAKIHEQGGRVVVKTLTPETDIPKEWRRVCEAGVDVVLTDRPRDLLAARGRW